MLSHVKFRKFQFQINFFLNAKICQNLKFETQDLNLKFELEKSAHGISLILKTRY